MTPILFYPTTEVFESGGIGNLTDCLSCVVTEERNGIFDLQMEYPVGGIFYKEIELRRIILAKPNPLDRPQPFRIVRVGCQMDGVISVCAQHVAYDLAGVVAKPIGISVDPKDAFSHLAEAIIGVNHFTFDSDITRRVIFHTNDTLPVWTILGGDEKMILSVYGGVYKFDWFTVRLLQTRGEDCGAIIKYGKNLIDMVKEEDTTEMYTGIVPFVEKGYGPIYLPEYIVSAGNYYYERLLPVDLTSEFEDVPTEDELRSAAEKYVEKNIRATPIINLDVENFQDLYDVPIHLCDLVTIEFPEFNITGKYPCCRTEYDVLAERYTRIGIGERMPSALDKLRSGMRAP